MIENIYPKLDFFVVYPAARLASFSWLHVFYLMIYAIIMSVVDVGELSDWKYIPI